MRKWGGGGGGGSPLFDNEDEPSFLGHVVPDQTEFLVIFYNLLQLDYLKLIGLGMPLSYLTIFEKCRPVSYCNDYKTSHIHTPHI